MLQFTIPKDIKQVQGTEIQNHYCFSCGQAIKVGGGEKWCPVCKWTICPHCGGCACKITKEAQMAVRGVFLTFCQYCNNPCKRKHPMTATEKKYTEDWEKTKDFENWKKEFPKEYREYLKIKQQRLDEEKKYK